MVESIKEEKESIEGGQIAFEPPLQQGHHQQLCRDL